MGSENEKDEKSVSEAVAEAEPETKGTLEVNDLPGEEVMTDKEAADKGSNESEKVLELMEEPKTTQQTQEKNEKKSFRGQGRTRGNENSCRKRCTWRGSKDRKNSRASY